MSRPCLPAGSPTAIYEPLTDSDREAVLKALESCPTVSAAVRAVFGDDRRLSAVRAAINADPIGFGARVDHARETYSDTIRQEIYRRGVIGVDRPLHFQGVPTGYTVKEYSDEMLKVAARLALKGGEGGAYLDKVSASDSYIHGEISVVEQRAGLWSISDQEALALPDDLKKQLANVLRYLAKNRREIAREQSHFAALTEERVTDAEYVEVASDDYDLAEVAKLA
jgi:hypothetical protein